MLQDCFIIILASGLGRRFDESQKIPKQLLDLNGKPLFYYSLETALSLVNNDKIILTYPPKMLKPFQDMLARLSCDVPLIEGGEKRQDSVLNALKSIKDDKSVVLIHDSARPLATAELFRRVYNCARLNGACVPLLTAVDTVKEVGDGIIKRTLDRKKIAFSQTPQGFKIELLKRVLRICDHNTEYTDEAMLLESYGIKVHTVEGEKLNLKLTFKEDIDIIKAFAKILWKTE